MKVPVPDTILSGVVKVGMISISEGRRGRIGNREQTVDALDPILDELANEGYQFRLLPGC